VAAAVSLPVLLRRRGKWSRQPQNKQAALFEKSAQKLLTPKAGART
jgi:hypothetical protein